LTGGCGPPSGIQDTDTLLVDKMVKRKSSTVFIPRICGEYLCAARAIVTCMAKLNNMEKAKFKALVNQAMSHSNKQDSQRCRAMHLHKVAGVPMNMPVAVTDLHKFEDFLNVQILVVSWNAGGELIYRGNRERKHKIFLLLHNCHFHSIVNIQGFYETKKLCLHCYKLYAKSGKHFCINECTTCRQVKCFKEGNGVICTDCNMLCRNAKCYLEHKKERMSKSANCNPSKKMPSLCQMYYKCLRCLRVLDRSNRPADKHKCGEWLCSCCEEYVLGDHLCFYRQKKPKITSGKFIFFDFETTQDRVRTCEAGYRCKPIPGCKNCFADFRCPQCRRCVNCNKSYCGLEEHHANFVVAQTSCDKCKFDNFTPLSKCVSCGDRCSKCSSRDKCRKFKHPVCLEDNCGRREVIFKGDEAADRFVDWLINPCRKGYTAIAHHGRGFDFHIILQSLIKNSVYPQITYCGSKIMSMKVSGKNTDLRFVDSLSFLPMGLKKLPKALNLRRDLKKGEFPYLFNCKTNFNYVGSIPDPYYYCVDFMSTEDRANFLEWYQIRKTDIFDFQKEILEYTRSDVEILREACTKFRDLIISITKVDGKFVDPFAHSTIATTAMQVMRELMLCEVHDITLKDGSKSQGTCKRGVWQIDGRTIDESVIKETRFIKSQIPQIPANGYRRHFNHSNKSIVWLDWLAKKSGKEIQHARNVGEYQIPNTRFHVDGFDPISKTVFEFLGCRWHGHTCINDRQAYDPRTKMSMDKLLIATDLRLAEIEAQGFKIQKIWECEFDKLLSDDEELKSFAAGHESQPPIKLRHSLFGGRTSPVKLRHDVAPGEVIRYYDFTSLYPFINYTADYPTGHPTIITTNFDETLEGYYGIVKLKILAPKDLFIPVLPYRTNGILKFPLCRKCAETENMRPCACSDQDRALIGTWTTMEVKKALEKGYTVVKIFEVYHYDQTISNDPGGSLFKEYVSMFLKIKQEASGYPDWVETEADKDTYIKYYHEKQGILLDKSHINKNDSMRFVSKLFLNSCWGKFCEQNNKTKSVYIKSEQKWSELKNDITKEIVNVHHLTHDVIAIDMKCAETFEDEPTFTCDIIGIFTTSLARLHLYEVLEKTNFRTLYFDTDSVLFIEKEGENILSTGDLLGELTDELPRATHITNFASSGPKSYTYKRSDGALTVKLKGITLNHKNSQVVNYNSVRDVVIDKIKKIRLPLAKEFVRVKHEGIIYNRPLTKTYKKTFTKRVIINNSLDSVPYGYSSD
jgi:hypothetical protein